MSRVPWSLVMLCLLIGAPARAADPSLGAQVASVLPTSPDLKLTTESTSGAVGLHLNLPLAGGLVVRPRLDAQFFSPGHQHTQDALMEQDLRTRVRTLGLGVDALVPVLGLSEALRGGVSVQELRWQVASVNTVQVLTGGSSEVAGTSTWWRFAWGPVLTFQVSAQVEIEGRLMLSRYGQENQPANTAALGVLWHF